MEPETLTEVVIQGPATAGEAALRRAVLRKLDHTLERQRGRAGRPSDAGPDNRRLFQSCWCFAPCDTLKHFVR